ncbi:interleukin-17 receptor B isoform X1 [Podarcis raffonei]|uniref:interleukin-17 receptor B isoform X1 n=1 Tax=Podarcis raffonei TaxID=65483 RepID=UPI0023295A00|nr:interleukin-17 receptor B isoform X1 [Podarcis raffonei]
MNAAVWLLLSVGLNFGSSEGEARQSIECYEENGPSIELLKEHEFVPSDISGLDAKIIERRGKCNFNITWSLGVDGSIIFLKASKICLQKEGSRSCIRCDYTERFQNQTMLSGEKWQFYYIGFPVDENNEYHIEVFNLPPPNPGLDPPKKHIKRFSPGCKDSVLKYCKTCIEKGSLWVPNITVCHKKSEVVVNFTASPFCSKYVIRLHEPDPSGDLYDHIVVTKGNDTRISEKILLTDQSNRTFKELIPRFPLCEGHCPRHAEHQELCTEEPTDVSTDFVGNYIIICCLLASLFLIVCMVAALLYYKRKYGAGRNWALSPLMQHIPATILVVYSQEVCFQHTVLAFAEFLHECCHSNVIIDAWQKLRIAEMGPVQWLATQKEIADKIIFLSPNNANPACDSTCRTTVDSHSGNSECMFKFAFNLFCSDWKNQSSLHKYMVVSFSEKNLTNSLPSPLNICPKYVLMKDIDSFCRDLSEHKV